MTNKNKTLLTQCMASFHLVGIAGLLLIILSACSDKAKVTGDFYGPKVVSQEVRTQAMEKWSRSCALCHVAGEGGAPKTGNREDWLPRIGQGTEVLLAHTQAGFNRMPPLGYCMDCSQEDFLIMIDFMAGAAR